MKADYAHVLLLDRDKTESRELRHALSRETPGFKCRVDVVDTATGAMSRLRSRRFDNVILNLSMNDGEDIRTVGEIHRSNPGVPIMIISESVDGKMRIAALKHGASDYFVKGTDTYEGIRQRIRHSFQERTILSNLVGDYCYRKALLRDAPSPIVCISLEGLIVEFNSEAELLWGVSRCDAIGRLFVEMFAEDSDKDTLKRCLAQSVRGHLTKNQRATLATDDADRHSLLWDMSRTTDGQGNTVAVIAVGHDKAAVNDSEDESAADVYGRYNPNFEDTAYMVLAGLGAIIEKMERIENADPAVLERLDKGLIAPGDMVEELSIEQGSAVERLIFSLIQSHAKTV